FESRSRSETVPSRPARLVGGHAPCLRLGPVAIEGAASRSRHQPSLIATLLEGATWPAQRPYGGRPITSPAGHHEPIGAGSKATGSQTRFLPLLRFLGVLGARREQEIGVPSRRRSRRRQS